MRCRGGKRVALATTLSLGLLLIGVVEDSVRKRAPTNAYGPRLSQGRADSCTGGVNVLRG